MTGWTLDDPGRPFTAEYEAVPTATNGNGHAPPRVVLPVLGEAARRGPLWEAAEASVPYTEASTTAVFAHLLTYFGIAVGPGPRLNIGALQMPARFHCWIAGDPSLGRKGAAWTWAKRICVWIDPGCMERVFSSYGSGESLIDDIAEGDDCRFLLVQTEAERILAVAERAGETLTTVLRDSWDSDALAARSRTKTAAVAMSHVGLIAHITPADLVGMSEAMIGNGFANRGVYFLVAGERDRPWPPSLDDDDAMEIAGPLAAAVPAARARSRVEPDPQAKEWWEVHYSRIRAKLASEEDQRLRQLMSRGDTHILRYAMVLALSEGTHTIRVAHLEAALAIWQFNADSVRILWQSDGPIMAAAIAQAAARPSWRTIESATRLAHVEKIVPVLRRTRRLTRNQMKELLGRHVYGRELSDVIAAIQSDYPVRPFQETPQRGGPIISGLEWHDLP